MSNPVDFINSRDLTGNTPLHTAVKNGHRKTVQLLLCLGADTTLLNSNNQTVYDLAKDAALHKIIQTFEKTIAEAALRGEGRIHAAIHLEDVESLPILTKIEGVYFRNKAGRTALHIAAGKKSIPLLRKIYTLGKDLEIRDDKGYNPLAIAVLEAKEVETVRFFLEAGAKPDIVINETPLLELAYNAGLNAIFQLLYSFIPKKGNRELSTILLSGNMKNLFIAINGGASIDINSLQPVIAAKQLNSVAFLINWFNLDIHQKMANGKTALEEATDKKIIHLLLQENAIPTADVLKNIHKSNNSSLFQKALMNIKKKEGTPERAELVSLLKSDAAVDKFIELLADGWDLKLPLANGETLMPIAAQEKNTKAIDFLLFIGLEEGK